MSTFAVTYPTPPTALTDLPEALRPAIEKYRDEADTLGRIPEDLLGELRERGAFRLYTPRELGRYEAEPAAGWAAGAGCAD